MAGYVIAQIKVNDPEGFKEYVKKNTVAVTQFGGKFLARGGKMEGSPVDGFLAVEDRVVDGDAEQDASDAQERRCRPLLEGEDGHEQDHAQKDGRHDRIAGHAKRPLQVRAAPAKHVHRADEEQGEEGQPHGGVPVQVLEVR